MYQGIAKSLNRKDHFERCQITIQSLLLITSKLRCSLPVQIVRGLLWHWITQLAAGCNRMSNVKKCCRIHSKNDRLSLTNNGPAVILLGLKCNLEFIKVVHVGKLYCTVLFVSILLTPVSNTDIEKVPTGAACADIQLQALQHNKRRERDITVALENL